MGHIAMYFPVSIYRLIFKKGGQTAQSQHFFSEHFDEFSGLTSQNCLKEKFGSSKDHLMDTWMHCILYQRIDNTL